MTSRDRQTSAATALEELESALKEIVVALRLGVPDPLAYALVYRLRREVGYVVANLGAGVPAKADDSKAAKIMGEVMD